MEKILDKNNFAFLKKYSYYLLNNPQIVIQMKTVIPI